MNLSRYLTVERIKLEMETAVEPYDGEASFDKWQSSAKEAVLDELVTLLENGNRIGNSNNQANYYRMPPCGG